MTLDELDTLLRQRRASLNIGHGPNRDIHVNLTSISWRRGKLVTGKGVSAHADTLADALELALLKYDTIWR